MRPNLTFLGLTALLLACAGTGSAQQAMASHKYLVPTSHYLKAETADLSALPEPPRPGSLAAEADLETILQLQGWRTDAEVAWAKRMDHLDAFDAVEALGPWFTRQNLPLCAQLLEETLGDGESMNYVAKLKFKRLRPPFQDPRVKPCLTVQRPASGPLPASYFSYPSGHATSIYLLAEILGDLVPARAEAVRDWAHKAAWSRMIGGVHFPSDNLGGRILAEITFKALKANPAFRELMERCRVEIRASQTSKAA